MSKIRWVARVESVHAVKLSYKQIIESLDAFENLPLFDTSTKEFLPQEINSLWRFHRFFIFHERSNE